MYRPNRIGPWPLIDLDRDTTILAGSDLVTASESLAKPGCRVQDTTVNESFRSWTVNFRVAGTLPTLAGCAVGVQIAGLAFANSLNSIVSYGGGCNLFAAGAGIQIIPIIGRAETDGGPGTDFICDPWAQVPYEAVSNDAAGGFAHQVTANGTVIEGPFNNTTATKVGSMFFGFWICNLTGSGIVITETQVSCSIHRYLHDIDTFDPNR